MIAAITKLINRLKSFSKYQKKDLEKIELKTAHTFNSILNFFRKTAWFSKWKPVPFGLPSLSIDKNIPYKKEIFYLPEEKLKCKILISEYNEGNNKNDFVIFFHGITLDHTQWLDKKGFGTLYHDVFKNDNKKLLPVVSISFGMSYIIKDRLPFPFEADLENIFIKKIVPYLRNKLNRKGKIHLIGHSIGGFSALKLSFKYPKIFKTVLAISPFIVKESPFNKNFKYYKDALKINPSWSYMVKHNLLYAFADENDWKENNPSGLISKINKKNAPLIIITQSEDELPGFNENINSFIKKLKEKNITFFYHHAKGTHDHSDITKAYISFFKNFL